MPPSCVVGTLGRAGMLAPMRPDKYVRMGLVVRRQGATPMTGIGLSAVRRPRRDRARRRARAPDLGRARPRSDALAAASPERDRRGGPRTVGILCRNHRGIVEALTATARVGADALLLNTGFSAPQLADVLARENAGSSSTTRSSRPRRQARDTVDGLVALVAWTDDRPTAARPSTS